MQLFVWQHDIVGVAHYILNCLYVLGALSYAPDDASTPPDVSPALAAGQMQYAHSPCTASHHALCCCPQPELRRVLYPLFIHTFLRLVERGAPGDAARFMARCKRRFLEGAAHASKMRRQVGHAPLSRLPTLLPRSRGCARRSSTFTSTSMRPLGCACRWNSRAAEEEGARQLALPRRNHQACLLGRLRWERLATDFTNELTSMISKCW